MMEKYPIFSYVISLHNIAFHILRESVMIYIAMSRL